MKKKSGKTSLSKIMPSSKNNKEINFTPTSFKNFEINNILSSPEKIKEEIFLPKKKGIIRTIYHRKTKSSSQNYVPYITNSNNKNNFNNSCSRLSYIFKGKDIINCNNRNKMYNSCSRNKYVLFKKKLKNNINNKKNDNLLSISFSLKDFRNNIINTFINSYINEIKNDIKHYNNITNGNNNKSIYIFDNLNNIEETRNTTSITGFNNSNLLYKNQMLITDNKNTKTSNYIKINKKANNNKIFSSSHNSSKIISCINKPYDNEAQSIKLKEKNKLYYYIYNNNIKYKNSLKKTQKNSNNLIISPKIYKNKKQNSNKLSFVNAISQNFKLHYKNKSTKKSLNSSKKIFNSNSLNKRKKNLENDNNTYKKRKNKSQKNDEKIMNEYNNEIKEFKSVEEIHFIFVQMIQKKKAFFVNHS